MVVIYYAKDVHALELAIIIGVQLVGSIGIFPDDKCCEFKL